MKNLKPIFLAIAIFFILPVIGFSQETKSLFKEGNKLFRLEHYRKALPFLEKVVEAEPNNAEAVFETGVCYLHRYSKEKALDYILKAYTLDSNVNKYIHYWLGRAYHQNYMYEKAINEYSIAKGDFSKADSRRKEIDKYIEQTNVAKQLTENPENFKVTNLGSIINTAFSEHSPVTSKNDSMILFTSRRNDVTGGKEDLDGEFFEDIYQSQRSNGKWTTPEKVQLNTSGHDASVQLFDNDTKLLIYRETKGGDIYVTEKDPATNAWQDPKKFANINTSDYEADAFITPDGKRAYFATNHYKKTGDLDIYYVTKNDDGSWNKPQELQGRINTSEDEDAPCISPDGKTLYFSSRGHKNMGGYDVFKSTLDSSTGNWSDPVNMGYPINTPDDDVYFYLSSNGKRGYFSSYREGGYGEKDIYEIAPIAPVIITFNIGPVCEGIQRKEMNYLIKSLNRNTKAVNLSGKVAGDKIEAKVYSYNAYHVSIYNSKDTLYSENIEIPYTENENEKISKEVNIPCPEGPKKDTTSVVAGNNYEHKYIFRNIYFEHEKAELTAEGIRELQMASEILKKNPSAEVKIKGFADGDENKSVASKRAKMVHDILKKNGVKNIISDTTEKVNGESVDGRSVALDVKLKEPLNKDFDPKVIGQASVGDAFILRSVYFETAKAELNKVSQAELEVLYNIMKDYPGIQIEIAGNTDSRGPADKNQALSEKRAQAVADYLKSQGIAADRVEPKGYGESNPIADNNTDKGRKLNRRTEFRVIKK